MNRFAPNFIIVLCSLILFYQLCRYLLPNNLLIESGKILIPLTMLGYWFINDFTYLKRRIKGLESVPLKRKTPAIHYLYLFIITLLFIGLSALLLYIGANISLPFSLNINTRLTLSSLLVSILLLGLLYVQSQLLICFLSKPINSDLNRDNDLMFTLLLSAFLVLIKLWLSWLILNLPEHYVSLSHQYTLIINRVSRWILLFLSIELVAIGLWRTIILTRNKNNQTGPFFILLFLIVLGASLPFLFTYPIIGMLVFSSLFVVFKFDKMISNLVLIISGIYLLIIQLSNGYQFSLIFQLLNSV